MQQELCKFIMTIAGSLVPAACLIAVSYVGCNQNLAVALICISDAFDGISQCGNGVNLLDIAPRYVGEKQLFLLAI